MGEILWHDTNELWGWGALSVIVENERVRELFEVDAVGTRAPAAGEPRLPAEGFSEGNRIGE